MENPVGDGGDDLLSISKQPVNPLHESIFDASDKVGFVNSNIEEDDTAEATGESFDSPQQSPAKTNERTKQQSSLWKREFVFSPCSIPGSPIASTPAPRSSRETHTSTSSEHNTVTPNPIHDNDNYEGMEQEFPLLSPVRAISHNEADETDPTRKLVFDDEDDDNKAAPSRNPNSRLASPTPRTPDDHKSADTESLHRDKQPTVPSPTSPPLSNPALTELFKKITAMREHNTAVFIRNDTIVAVKNVDSLTTTLEEKIIQLSSKQNITQEDWAAFEKDFLETINNSYKSPAMRKHRSWKPMLMNLACAVIAIGVAFVSGGSIPAITVGLLLLAKTSHSVYTSGNWYAFHSKTTRQEKLDDIKKQLSIAIKPRGS